MIKLQNHQVALLCMHTGIKESSIKFNNRLKHVSHVLSIQKYHLRFNYSVKYCSNILWLSVENRCTVNISLPPRLSDLRCVLIRNTNLPVSISQN